MIPAPALGSRGRRRIVSLAVAVLVVLGGGSRASASPSTAAGPYRAGQVLVGFDPDVPAQERRAIVRAVGARRAPGDPRLGTARRTPSSKAERLVAASETLAVPAARVSAVVALLRRQRGVRYAEPDYLLHESASPNDPGFAMQWGFSNTGQAANGTAGSPGSDEHVTPAWSLTTGSRSVVVAEVDSGVDYNHPDLAANVWTNDGTVGGCPAGTHGYNVVASTCDPMDDETPYRGHGTHVAGILGAVGNNGVGVTGVNWATTILPVKWTNSAGDGSTSQLLTALDWVVKARQAGVNVRVVNDSVTYKGTASSQALSDRIDLLGANDILFVTAAGNTGDNNDNPTVGRYPCRYGRANEICVTASDQQDRLPSWANYGPGTVDLAAPGDQIYSTLRGGAYGYISGGSMASPQVAGAAALILSRGYRSATALKADILDYVDPIPALAGQVRTGGRLDICRAMGGCPNSTTPPPASAPPGSSGAPVSSDAVAAARSLLWQAGRAPSVLDIAGRLLRFGRLSNPSGSVQRTIERVILAVPGRTRGSRPRRIDLGRGTLVLGPHASGRVVLRVSRRVLQLVAGNKRLRARVDITVVPSIGAPQRQARTVFIPVRSGARR